MFDQLDEHRVFQQLVLVDRRTFFLPDVVIGVLDFLEVVALEDTFDQDVSVGVEELPVVVVDHGGTCVVAYLVAQRLFRG